VHYILPLTTEEECSCHTPSKVQRQDYKTHHNINPVLKLPYLHSYTYYTHLVRRMYYITLIKILHQRNTLFTITKVQNFPESELESDLEFIYISHRYHTLLNINIHTYLITAVPYRHLICKNITLYSLPLINVYTAVTVTFSSGNTELQTKTTAAQFIHAMCNCV
jgi:hypothetical protein